MSDKVTKIGFIILWILVLLTIIIIVSSAYKNSVKDISENVRTTITTATVNDCQYININNTNWIHKGNCNNIQHQKEIK